MADSLSQYRRKRRAPTPEPSGKAGRPAQAANRFVVHEHHARRLHWDLRLEREGVLASWAIPNGIPCDPKHNRKAVHVEDHPLEYIDFEGTIPRGSYGAGEVMIFDRGTYTCEKWEPEKVVVSFDGQRLKGRYALFHAGKDEKDWMIHRMDPASDPSAEEMPEFVEPMLARLSTMPPADSRWAFEVKWDGVRAIARCRPGRLALLTRNRNEVTSAYPELRGLMDALGSHEAMLDGEIVAFDQQGRPSFQALQGRMHLRGDSAVRRLAARHPVTYLIFDLLWLDGHSLMELPYEQRRARLLALELHGEHWRTPAHHLDHGDELLAQTRKHGLEGVIAKRLDSPYTPGSRGGDWLKIKNSQRQELVIGGWTEGKGARRNRFGALELGVHDRDGALRYAGKVGTGFSEQELDRLMSLLRPLARKTSPFTGPQPAKGTHFVRPTLVAEIEFSEWTDEGRLRQASYQGLRDDKPAAEVMREAPAPPPREPEKRSASKPRRGQASKHAHKGLADLLESSRAVSGGVEVQVQERTLKLTNLDKVLYPLAGFTKGDLIDWYVGISPVLLPHLRDRPLTLKRYPDGVQGEYFYEKRAPRHRPEWVRTVAIPSERRGADIDYTLCQDLPTLIWLANLADIELHPSLSRAPQTGHPTTLAFDLDPGPPAGIVECCEVALMLREIFGEFDIESFAKTSGSKGLQVYVPLNRPGVDYEQTKGFARAVASLLQRRHPERVIAAMSRAARKGKVLIDWSQNDQHKTTVCVYSLRAMERPTVSTPVSWEEVQATGIAGKRGRLAFEADEVLRRVAAEGDLFADVIALQQSLPDLHAEGR
jgi:bifunctional non-homologous end joining protein LigD